MTVVEYADGRHGRAGGQFPDSWGFPPGTADSEQRARWIREHVRREMAGTMTTARAAQMWLNRLDEE